MMMSRYFQFLMRRSWWILAAYLLISLLAASQLGKLRLDISPQSFTVDDQPERAFFSAMSQTFGSDDITVVLVSDPDLFSPAKLAALQTAISRMHHLPFVKKVESLLTLPDIRVIDDLVLTDPFFSQPAKSEAETREILDRARKNPFVLKNLLSEDEKTLAINLYILEGAISDSADNSHVADLIEKEIANLRTDVAEAFQLGQPYIRDAVSNRVQDDQKLIMPSALLILFLSLLLVLRKPYAMLVPMLTSAVSILWVLGFLAAIDLPLNIMTAMVPLILIIVGSTEDIHLITEHLHGNSKGYSGVRAVRYMLKKMGLAVALTALTSSLGFLSIALNRVEIVREFGLVTAAALAINFVITMSLLPILLQRVGDAYRKMEPGHAAKRRNQPFARALGDFILSNRIMHLSIMGLLVVVALLGASQLYVNNSILEYFSPNDPIRTQANQVANQLSGVETFSIAIDGHVQGTFDKPRYLEEIQHLQGFVSDLPGIDFSASVADYLSILNSIANEDGEYILPEEEEIIAYLLAIVGADEYKHYLTADHSQANIIVRHHLSSSRDLNKALKQIREFINRDIDPALDIHIFGDSVLSSNATDDLAISQIKALGAMLIAIYLIISLLFANPFAGLVALIPNLFPLVMLFGAMGYLGIPLDTGTSIIAAITIGIGVDHTMHFMIRYNENLHGADSAERAIFRTLAMELLPMSAASVSLAAGLATLTLSSFNPIIYFGFLSSIAMLLAFYANIIILPALLYFVRLTSIWEMFSLPVQRNLVAACPLVSGMKGWQARQIFRQGRIQRYSAGDVIMREGDPANAIFILLEGEVEIVRNMGSAQANHSAVALGHAFGIAAILGGVSRMATATALTECKIMVLTNDRLTRLARIRPGLAYQLMRNASRLTVYRLRIEENDYGSGPVGSPGGRSPDMQTEAASSFNRE